MSGSAPEPLACALCGARVGREWLVGVLGDIYCVSHGSAPSCRGCGAPAGPEQYCAGCAPTRVLDQARVRAVLPTIRGELHRLGIRLAKPVQVELVSPDVMQDIAEPWDATPDSTATGLTISSGDQVVRLTIVSGLPLVRFGAVVAHEAMHAWMTQHRFPEDLALPLCEGLCQLTAFSWLRRQSDPRALVIRESMETDPDPAYGAGFRTVRDAVARHGLKPVLAALRDRGRLP